MNRTMSALLTAIAIAGVTVAPSAHADGGDPGGCWLPPGGYARHVPAGMDNYLWPPCDPPGVTTWTRTTLWNQECMYSNGNPDGSWCWYTNPANGHRYLRWGYHARPSEDILLPTDPNGAPCAHPDVMESRTVCGR